MPEPHELKSRPKDVLKIHQMIILSTLRYSKTAYGSASKTVLRKLDPIYHRGVGLAFGTFSVCKTENVLCERRKHDEDRNKNIDERKPPYQIINDKPEHLRQLCNETRITKTLLHMSGRTSRTNEH
jgi:hypothetical protein